MLYDNHDQPSSTLKANESDIEAHFIQKLQSLKYSYRPDIRDRASLEVNFRQKFETLNRVHLADSEFKRLLDHIVSTDVFANAQHLREQNSFERDDGTPLFYRLVNKDWCKNDFEVVNQLRINTDNSFHRYDVILLINGIPMVQIELKTLHISPRRAMQQIVDYKNDAGNGYQHTLLCFMQLFIVSNQSNTYYFANNNRAHFSFDADERFLPVYQFADEKNQKINELYAFADVFLTKCLLGEMISRYMVLVASEKKLLLMRPYQIYAVKAIADCIEQNRGNGFIWHTTGSGKTLTSFKASTLLKENPNIHKCLFVVDRKDLDRQTREEFNKFQEGCVEENTNTDTMVERLLSDDYTDKVIVTTIQKLGLALEDTGKRNYRERLASLSSQRIVFIFDECHRSQFGENHKAIKAFFPNAQLFGFTGTPIFDKNSTYQQIEGKTASAVTTLDIFQKELHAYTITHAIDDQNVLRFRVDYFKPDAGSKVKTGEALAKKAVIKAILEKHDIATAGRKFNAVLATASINDAIEYHALFKAMQAQHLAEHPDYVPLTIACVFSPPADGNKDVVQIQEDLPTEQADNQIDPEGKKTALKSILADYNAQYSANHDIGHFDNYYQDVQKRIKDQQYDLVHGQKIDIVIVVDMLLTGFDSKYLNTLYVDKNLKYHGLIQAFSRTNRILNDSKPWGNILDFRQQQEAVNEAITLFSGSEQASDKEIWLVDDAPKVISNYQAAVQKLETFMGAQGLTLAPAQVSNLKGDEARAQFVTLFKDIQKLKTQLDQYTDLTKENTHNIEQIIPDNQLRAFRSMYLETAQRLKEKQDKNEGTEEVEQLDFEFVLFASAIVDYDYIVKLMKDLSQSKGDKQSMSREELISLILSDAKFMEERNDLVAYIDTLKAGEALSEKVIREGYESFKAKQSAKQLADIAQQYGLPVNAVQDFVAKVMQRMVFDGEALSDLLAPLDLGWKARAKKETELMAALIPLFHKLAKGRDISGLKVYE